MDDVLVTAGGIIPDDDVAAAQGGRVWRRCSGPGTTIREVADFIRATRSRATSRGRPTAARGRGRRPLADAARPATAAPWRGS